MLFSVIIPVYGQWHLTKNCLLSLKKEIEEPFEVILIDNGACKLENDKTREEAPTLGKELFGDNFVYLPQKTNLNFAGGSNLGAKIARSELLFFLNNDTEVQPNFLPPLLQAFEDTNEKIMVAPILLYPEGIGNAKNTIQHLGVFITPNNSVGHLYEHFPSNHRVAKKQRRLQCITAAAFFMRKNDFFELNGFDENFINGFEDVDLCARFKNIGGMMYVMPQSKIIHLCSQSQGRSDAYKHNSDYLHAKGSRNFFTCDYEQHLIEDGFELHIGEWLNSQPELNPKVKAHYNIFLVENNYEKIKEVFYQEPFWTDGFNALINHSDATVEDLDALYLYRGSIAFSFPLLLEYTKFVISHHSTDRKALINKLLEQFNKYTENRVSRYKSMTTNKLSTQLFREIQFHITNHEKFMETTYKSTLQEIKGLISLYSK